MTAIPAPPTPFSDVNAVLHELLASVQAVLGDRFVGLYLYGSLATGDFDPQRSDVDFVVVTAGEIPREMIPALGAMHARMAASDTALATKLEGSYIPQDALARYDPNDLPRPCVNEGRFYLGRQGSDWVIQRHTLREQAVVVAGPDPRTLIDPIGPDDLRRAVLAFLHEWWSPMLQSPDPRLRGGEYQAYAILTMCRALYTLQMGTVVAKSVAARWAKATVDAQWASLIEEALAWRPGEQLDRMSETLDFIRYAVERSRCLEPVSA